MPPCASIGFSAESSTVVTILIAPIVLLESSRREFSILIAAIRLRGANVIIIGDIVIGL
jgi:hypothetical protein